MDGKKLSDQEKRAIIDEWWQSGGFQQMKINARKVCSASAMYSESDALMHIISYFYNLPLKKQWEIHTSGPKGTEKYLTKALAMEVKSSTSGFYTKYRKPLIRERQLTNVRGEVKYEQAYELSDGEELEGRMKCLRYFYDNEASDIDKWLIEQKVFYGKKNPQLIEEFDIPDKDLTNHWTTLKARMRRFCNGY